MRAPSWFIATTTAAVLAIASSHAAAPKFYPDDPLPREPETQDASRAEEVKVDLFSDLLVNLFMKPGDLTPGVRAGNINTIDEVPDSSWFTNRIGTVPLTGADISRGANVGKGPAPGRWTVISAKMGGAAPGFTVSDSQGEVWFLSLDIKRAPRAATGAIAVASRLYWALGYHQVESYLASFRPGDLDIPETTLYETRTGHERPMTPEDIDQVLNISARNADGSYRVMAGRLIPGRRVGGFRYHGTRSDDPNDIVPHEHRRELRALQVFGAWTNFIDMKALNTIDTVVEENGRHVVRHYLQDVGSMFGTGAYEPHDWDNGHEYLYEGGATWRRLVTAGFYLQPWQTKPFYDHPELGRIEAQGFDPDRWKPTAPNAALRQARADDTFWAALRVAAFSEEMIRAAVHEARYADPDAEALLTRILMERRQVILRTYLPRITPLTSFALNGTGRITFENAAVKFGVAGAPAGGYRAAWFTFDNATQTAAPIGESASASGDGIDPPAGWRDAQPGAYVKVSVHAVDPSRPAWAKPIDLFFRRTVNGWQLVGVERTIP
jgi:hypothetical protein